MGQVMGRGSIFLGIIAKDHNRTFICFIIFLKNIFSSQLKHLRDNEE